MNKLQQLIELCKASVHLTINDHRAIYQTVEYYLMEQGDDYGNKSVQAIPADVRAKMIETNTIIQLQFYPDTPIGFYVLYHYDLDTILDHAIEIINRDRT